MPDLRKRGIVSKMQRLKTGNTVGGNAFTSGPLSYLLRNRFYIGEVVYKGEILLGEQKAIIDRDLFDAVQTKLAEQQNNYITTRARLRGPLARPDLRRSRQSDEPKPRPQEGREIPILHISASSKGRAR